MRFISQARGFAADSAPEKDTSVSETFVLNAADHVIAKAA